MGIQLIDGKGTGGAAEVRNQKLVTLSSALTPLALASLDGRAYSFSNVTADLGAAATIIALRNDQSTKNFHIYDFTLQTDIASEIQCHIVTLAYTAAGTSITPVNLNSDFGNSSQVTAFGNETGNAQGSIIHPHINMVAAAVLPTYYFNYGGALILAPGHAFGIDTVVNIGAGLYCSVTGYVEE